MFVVALWRSRSRLEAYALAVVYFASGLWPIIPATQAFFHGKEDGVSIWLAAALCLAVPFGLVWSRKWRAMTVPAAILIHAFSPWGIASPILSVPVAVGAFRPVPKTRGGWVAVNTHFQPNEMNDFARLQWMRDYAMSHRGSVFVFPESMVRQFVPGPWDSSVELSAAHKTIIFGSTEPLRHEWTSEVVAIGEHQGVYIQRVPLPYAMWGKGYRANLSGSSVMDLGTQRAGVAVCYESAIVRTVVQALVQKPSVLIVPVNAIWAAGIPEVEASERISAQAWGRAFGIPVLFAENK